MRPEGDNVRFSSINIKNYRQYRSLELKFAKADHDLQVIIGDNGTGKTNLLNAFTWCLYGTEPHLGSSDKYKGEPKLNKDAISDALQSDNGVVTIEVTIEIETGDSFARITRRLPVRVTSALETLEKRTEETFSVQCMPKSGVGNVLTGELADNYVSRILPEGIREYFFFDGEQLGSYFSDGRNAAIKSAIHSISQIDIVTLMRERTDACVKSLRRSLKGESPDFKEITDKIERCEGTIKQADSNIAKFEQQAEQAQVKIDELSENLRGIPDIAALEQERDALKKRAKSADEHRNEAESRYIRFARGAYVDFAFYEAAQSALKTIEQMERDHQLPPSIDRRYVEGMLRDRVCRVCNRPLDEDECNHLRKLLEEYQVSNETSHILTGMNNELRRLVDRVGDYPKRKNAVLGALKERERDLEEINSKLEDVEKKILGYPDSEKIKLWYEQRERLTKEYEKIRESIGAQKDTRRRAENLLERARKDLSGAMKKIDEHNRVGKEIDFGQKAVRILDLVEKEVIQEVRTLMAQRTEELFKGLVWKDSKCDRVELSETYQLSLYDRAGYSCAGTCSAAERALLALSFTLAMHEVSGFDSPLFIDTPIARASGDNRANFAETLAEVSKDKQLILTFTPDEYSESIASVFDPIAASNLRLKMDAGERVVTVVGNEA